MWFPWVPEAAAVGTTDEGEVGVAGRFVGVREGIGVGVGVGVGDEGVLNEHQSKYQPRCS
jgi:hypothetical protein